MSRRRELAALAACLAVVAAVTVATGDREDAVPMRYVDVGVGETGTASEFDVEVLEVRLAQRLLRYENSEPLTTDARFVVVEVSADVRTDTQTFYSDVWLVTTTGDRYAPRSEFTSAQPPTTEPGFTVTGSYVFQVPIDRVAEARFQVDPDTPLFITHDTSVRVDLGLTDDTPIVTEPILLDPPSTVVTS